MIMNEKPFTLSLIVNGMGTDAKSSQDKYLSIWKPGASGGLKK